ncbi:hypothetical protein [Streptomyces hebeiensis]
METVPALPLTETGKVRKAALRERGVTSRTWDRAAVTPGTASSPSTRPASAPEPGSPS